MANFYGSARTNYVQIDWEKAEAFAKSWDIKAAKSHSMSKEGELPWVCFLPGDQSDDGCFPTMFTVEDDEHPDGQYEREFSWHEIYSQLPANQGLVVQTVGAEKLRYLAGYSEVYSNQGLVDHINLGDIYRLATQDHGLEVTTAEY